jgi:PhnB protein
MLSIMPVLVVEDIKNAIGFYSKLGFVEEKEYTFTDEAGSVIHAQLRKAGSVLFLGRMDVSYYEGKPRAERIKSAGPTERGLGVTFILQTENLDGIVRFAQDAGLEVLYGPADEWYGDRVFIFLDPFGYEWKASQASSLED